MTAAVSPPTTARAAKEPSALRLFRERHGTPHLMLAYHAALPLALTPELLYSIWANFQTDLASKSLDIPWIAVSDLLLSGFCEVVGHELYKLDPKVRERLLTELGNQSNLGEKRIQEIATFLDDTVRSQLNSEDIDIRDFAQAQRWTALAYLKPEAVAKELTQALSDSYSTDRSDLLRTASIVDALHKLLKDFPALIVYAKGMAALAIGDLNKAKQAFSKLNQAIQANQMCGVQFPQIKEIKTASQSELQPPNKRNINFSQSWKKLVNLIKDPSYPPIIPIVSAIVIMGAIAAVSHTNNLFLVDEPINSSLPEPPNADNLLSSFLPETNESPEQREIPTDDTELEPSTESAPSLSPSIGSVPASAGETESVAVGGNPVSASELNPASVDSQNPESETPTAEPSTSPNASDNIEASSPFGSGSRQVFPLSSSDGNRNNSLRSTIVAFETENHAVRVFGDQGEARINVVNKSSGRQVVSGMQAIAQLESPPPYDCWVTYFAGSYTVRVSGYGEAVLESTITTADGVRTFTEPRISSVPLITNVPQNDRRACFGSSGGAPTSPVTPYVVAAFGDVELLFQVRQLLTPTAELRDIGGLTCVINPRFESVSPEQIPDSVSEGLFINIAECSGRDDAEALVSFLRGKGFEARHIFRDFDYRFEEEEPN